MKAKHSGFTLVELMIVVAVIGIISAVAIPSYRSHVVTANRAEAQAFMADCSTKLERHFSQNMTWAGATLSSICPVPPTSSSPLSTNYAITLPTATSSAYLLRAVAQGSQASDKCVTLEINSAGSRSGRDSNNAAASCW